MFGCRRSKHWVILPCPAFRTTPAAVYASIEIKSNNNNQNNDGKNEKGNKNTFSVLLLLMIRFVHTHYSLPPFQNLPAQSFNIICLDSKQSYPLCPTRYFFSSDKSIENVFCIHPVYVITPTCHQSQVYLHKHRYLSRTTTYQFNA